ncbi:MAG: multicopper oxidase domain-containing protein, partial [Propioniciclava sp.]|nr:multicopper oxidase domain-containing protein [Propioniciclava sp.]
MTPPDRRPFPDRKRIHRAAPQRRSLCSSHQRHLDQGVAHEHRVPIPRPPDLRARRPAGRRPRVGVRRPGELPRRRRGTVRVRVVNTDNSTIAAWVARGRFRVLAIDGGEVAGGDELTDLRVGIGAGGRVDLGVRVPDAGAVRVQVAGASLVVGPAGSTAPTAAMPAASFDPIAYGTPAPPPFDPATADRRFAYDIGHLPGFLGGHPGWWWTINGRMVPHVPMYMVSEGDRVAMRITNASGEAHPMHLHGHHLTVVARNGVPATGAPWVVDSLDVGHGET